MNPFIMKMIRNMIGPINLKPSETSYTKKDVIVTTSWDDGHKLDLKLACMLQKYNMKGTFYISPSYMKEKLSEEEIRRLALSHEVGAHTLNHVNLLSVPLMSAEKEIVDSKLYLEKILDHKVRMFCYPDGHYNKRIERIVETAGFLGARTCIHGDASSPNDPYEWHITLHASNGSPLQTLRIWYKSRISVLALIDWEIRAKLLFDYILSKGGVYHIWGHSWEIQRNNEWNKLERVLDYISNRNRVQYKTNGEVIQQLLHRSSEL